MNEKDARWEHHQRMLTECFVFSLRAWEELGVCNPVDFIMSLKRAERERQKRQRRTNDGKK